MKALKTYVQNSTEYNRLKEIMDKFNSVSDKVKLTIENTYVDFHQNWLYTTLIANRLTETSKILSSHQALSPKEQEIAIYGSDVDRYNLLNTLITKYVNNV